MITLQNRERVKSLVIDAFSSIPKPSTIAIHDCEECEDLRLTFKDQDWKQLDPNVLAANAWDLPLLSPEAFRYFLPGWIIAVLDEWGDPWLSHVFIPTLYGLAASGADQEWLRERYVFSKNQKLAMIEFLKLVLQEPKFQQFHVYADSGLRIYG
jgi:hypothetical protein